MRTSRIGLWAALFIAIALWFFGGLSSRDTLDAPEAPIFILGKTIALDPIECYQPWRCTFNVIGVENVLGRSVMVHIDGIRAAHWGAICSAESDEGQRGTAYLYEMLASANNITLIRPYKIEGNHVLIGRVLVDGKDVAQKMIDLGVAAPPGVRMNWCESVKKFEV
jgi:hypothetical protein